MVETLTKKLFRSYKDKCRGVDIKGNPVLSKKDAETYFLNIFNDGTREVFCRYREANTHCNISKEEDSRDNGYCHYMIKNEPS